MMLYFFRVFLFLLLFKMQQINLLKPKIYILYQQV